MTVIKIWYYIGFPNFGDLLSVFLLNSYGKKKNLKFVHSGKKENAKVLGIGSILHSIPSRFSGHIWTTGGLKSPMIYKHNPNNTKVWGLRGKLTASIFNIDCKTLGDAGLLVGPVFGNANIKKKYKIGLIPHYVDQEYVKSLPLVRNNRDIKIIDVTNNPLDVIYQIQQCSVIFSSSLHGLIVADSFHIPNRQFICPTSIKIRGGMFKFHDYYSVFSISTPKVIKLTREVNLFAKWYKITKKYYCRPGIKQIQTNLHEMTQNFINNLQM